MAKWTSRIVVAWLALASSLTARAASGPQLLRVLSFNFNSEVVAFDDRKEIMRDARFKAMVELMANLKPDIVFIQEGWNYRGFPSVAIPLGRATGYDYFYRLGEGFPGLLYDSNIILAKKSLKMKETRKIKLPHSAPSLGDGVHWIIPFGAITQAVGVRLTLDNGEPLFAYCTHLLGKDDGQRRDQLAALDKAIRAHARKDGVSWDAANAIVTGDFNSTPDSSPVALFTSGLGYADTWGAAHPDHWNDEAAATDCSDPHNPHFNPMNLGAGQLPAQSDPGPDSRIDYIFARGPRVRTLASTVVFTQPYGGFWISDHYGVLTTLAVGEGEAPPVDNRLSDSDGEPVIVPTRVLDVTDAHFAPCDHAIDCDLGLGTQQVEGLRGFAVVNKSSDKIFVKVTGPGRVLPGASVSLNPGQASSFVLGKSGSYMAAITNSVGDSLRAPVQVRLPEF